MTTGKRIKERRKELKMTADEVAARLGVSRSTVFRYENGDIEKVPGDTLDPLSKILQCSPAYLMGWTEEKPTTVSDDGLWSALCKDDRKLALVKWISTLDDRGLDRFEKILDIVDPPTKE